MAGYGMVILGPSLHFWFNYMSKLFPKRDIFSTLKKMFMGQALYGPAMTVVFFSVNAFLQGTHDFLSHCSHIVVTSMCICLYFRTAMSPVCNKTLHVTFFSRENCSLLNKHKYLIFDGLTKEIVLTTLYAVLTREYILSQMVSMMAKQVKTLLRLLPA